MAALFRSLSGILDIDHIFPLSNSLPKVIPLFFTPPPFHLAVHTKTSFGSSYFAKLLAQYFRTIAENPVARTINHRGNVASRKPVPRLHERIGLVNLVVPRGYPRAHVRAVLLAQRLSYVGDVTESTVLVCCVAVQSTVATHG